MSASQLHCDKPVQAEHSVSKQDKSSFKPSYCSLSCRNSYWVMLFHISISTTVIYRICPLLWGRQTRETFVEQWHQTCDIISPWKHSQTRWYNKDWISSTVFKSSLTCKTFHEWILYLIICPISLGYLFEVEKSDSWRHLSAGGTVSVNIQRGNGNQ